MNLEMDKEAILPSGPYHSEQLYHSHLLWFKIITLSLQTDISEGSNTRVRNGASTSGCKTEKTSPTHESTKKTSLEAQQTLAHAA